MEEGPIVGQRLLRNREEYGMVGGVESLGKMCDVEATLHFVAQINGG